MPLINVCTSLQVVDDAAAVAITAALYELISARTDVLSNRINRAAYQLVVR